MLLAHLCLPRSNHKQYHHKVTMLRGGDLTIPSQGHDAERGDLTIPSQGHDAERGDLIIPSHGHDAERG